MRFTLPLLFASGALAAIARRGVVEEPVLATTTLDALPLALRTAAPRADKLECFSTKTVKTSTCPVSTNDGKPTTQDCFPTEVTKSECAPGLMCTLDSKGDDICMELKNGLEIDGIIIAIVFAVCIAVGIGYLTFMCCRDSRQNKHLAAKAEATALARAQTKKMRAQESRAPLMRSSSAQREQQGGAPALAGGDPFADRAHS